jgi:sugar O-acyltransferase (sialic acid O-acetyltransferase NeuD family)
VDCQRHALVQMMSPPSRLPIVIFGCGGHGRVVADALKVARAPLAGFLDDRPPAPIMNEIPVIGNRGCLEQPEFLKNYAILIAIGEPRLRRQLALLVLDRGGRLAKAIHPSAIIAADVAIGQGTVIMAGVVINTGTRIGRFAIVNTGATIDHDNVIEDGVHISPGCHLAGNVICRADAFVGTGASIIPRTQIGARAVIGAGAAVISDVPPDTLAAGCPAVVKRSLLTARSSIGR